FRAVAVGGADTVGAGVAAADDHHVLAARRELGHVAVTRHALVLQREEFHREVHAVQLAPRDRQVAGLLGSARQYNSIKFLLEVIRRHALPRIADDRLARRLVADEDAGAELDALGAQLLQTPVDHRLLELEVRNAVAQQTADAIALLEHGDVVPGARELLRAGEARAARAHHRHLLAGLVRRGLRAHPAFFPGLVDDRVLDRLDADGVAVDAQHARFLARRGADAAGELGEVVGGVQRIDRALPVLAVHQIVPVRDDVVHRTARHAERDAAVHAARALRGGVGVGQAGVKLPIVLLAAFGL